MLTVIYSSDERVHELVVALLHDAFNPYRLDLAKSGPPTIVTAVREQLGDDAARTVRITVH